MTFLYIYGFTLLCLPRHPGEFRAGLVAQEDCLIALVPEPDYIPAIHILRRGFGFIRRAHSLHDFGELADMIAFAANRGMIFVKALVHPLAGANSPLLFISQ